MIEHIDTETLRYYTQQLHREILDHIRMTEEAMEHYQAEYDAALKETLSVRCPVKASPAPYTAPTAAELPEEVTFTFGPAVMSATSKAGGTRTLTAEWSVPEGSGAEPAGDGLWTITVPAGEEPSLTVTGTAEEGTASTTVNGSWRPTLKAYLYFAPAGTEWSEELGWNVFEPGKVAFTCPAGLKAHVMAPWPVEVTQFGLRYCMDPADAATPWGAYMRYEALEPTNGLEQIIDVRKL